MVIKWEKRLLKSATAGPKTLPVTKLVVVGVVESGELADLDGGCLKGRLEGENRAGGS